MNQHTILNVNSVNIVLSTYKVNDKHLYRAQDLLQGYGMEPKQRANTMKNWVRSVQRKTDGAFSPIARKGGVKQGTYLTKLQLLKLASYVSSNFENAVYEAFELLTTGHSRQAAELSGTYALNSELVEKVSANWKEFIRFAYDAFKPVNSKYGANIIYIAMKSALGQSKVCMIKGKDDAKLIERLVEQRHGDAIQALDKTIQFIRDLMELPSFKSNMQSREGMKQVYADIKVALQQ